MAKLTKRMSELQRKARNKEARIRKKARAAGMMEDVIDAMLHGSLANGKVGADDVQMWSPVVPAAQIEKMTRGQRQAYMNRLKKFTSRDYQVQVHKSDEPQDSYFYLESEVRERKGYIATINKTYEKLQREIERKVGAAGLKYRKQDGTGHYDIYRRKGLTLPQTRKWFEKGLEADRQQARRKPQQGRRQLQKNIIKMLRELNEPQLANYIDSLNTDEFDVLISGTNFTHEMLQYYGEVYGDETAEVFEIQAHNDRLRTQVDRFENVRQGINKRRRARKRRQHRR